MMSNKTLESKGTVLFDSQGGDRVNFYISDLHFGHRNEIGFDHRPFMDRDEMDHCLIKLWNGRVQDDDNVYIVGDLCYRNDHPAEWYLRQLRGHKFLILGNHDHPILENPKALHYLEGVEKMMRIQDDDQKICLCHFPIAEWNEGLFIMPKNNLRRWRIRL